MILLVTEILMWDSNDQETDMEENQNADFEIYKIICLFFNLLKFYARIFVATFGGHLGALEVCISI